MKRLVWKLAPLTLAGLLAVTGAALAQPSAPDRSSPGGADSYGNANERVPNADGEERMAFGGPDGAMARGGRGGMGRGGPGGPMMRGGPGGPGHDPPPGLHMPPPEVLEQLDLTDAQRDRLAELRQAEMRTMIRAEADARIAEMDLRDLVESDRPDEDAIGAAVERVAELRAAMLREHVESYLAMRSVLHADQRAKLRRLGPPSRER